MIGYLVGGLGILIAVGVLIFFYRKKEWHSEYALMFLMSVIIALSLEVFTFNYATFSPTAGEKQVMGTDVINTTTPNLETGASNKEKKENPNIKTAVAPMGTDTEYTFEFDIKDTKLSNICVEPTMTGEYAIVDVQAEDAVYEMKDGTQAGFVKSPVNHVVVKDIKKSHYIKTHFPGTVKKLKVVVKTENNQTLSHIQLTTNPGIPFTFNFARYIIVAIAFFLAFCVYKNRKLSFRGQKSKWVRRIAIIVLLVIESVVIINLGTGEVKELKFNENIKTAEMDQYQQLTLALTKGKVDLNALSTDMASQDKQALEVLQKTKNPYNIDERNQKGYEGSRWDFAYYKGKFYTYYGIVPVVVFYLPVYIITGKMLSTRMLTILLAIALACIFALFVYMVARRRKTVNLWTVIATMAGVFSASFILSCMHGAKFYETSPMSGLLFAMIGVTLTYEAFKKNSIHTVKMVLGALCLALAVGCKANYLFASVAMLPFILVGFARQGKVLTEQNKKNKFTQWISNIFNKKNIKQIIICAIPFVVVGGALMVYNYMRFGSPIDFGVNYQLTLFNVKYYDVKEIAKLPIVLYNGFFAMPKYSNIFPFVNPVLDDLNYAGYFFQMHYVGLFAFPMMWLAAMLPWSYRRGLKRTKQRTLVSGMIIVGLILTYVIIVKGGSSLRYNIDFAWLLILPIIFVILDLDEYARPKKIVKYVVALILALCVSTVLIGTLINLSPDWTEMGKNLPGTYYNWFYSVMFWC